MTVSPQIPSDRDLELLSAYLDGELADREKEKLEQRLARENALRAVLDDLRETVTLVSDLPRLKAPRSFTLDPAVYGRPVGRPVPWWQRLFTLESALQLSGALGAAASILLIILAVLFTQEGSEKSSMSAKRPASESSQVAIQPTLAESEAEETALAYAGNDLLQTTMAAQNTYYATHQAMTPTLAPTQATLSMAAPAGEESFQDTTTAPTEVAQEMAAGMVAQEAAPLAPDNEQPTIMMEPDAYPPAVAQDAVGAAAPQPAAASVPTASAGQMLFAPPQEIAPTTEEGFREQPQDQNTREGESDGMAANAAGGPTTGETETMLPATATPAPATQAEKDQPETQTARRGASSEESSSWWLAGIGLAVLAASIMLFVWGRRRARA